MEEHKKSWGRELWLVNNHLYCGKVLEFEDGATGTSMHFHKNKTETMWVLQGELLYEWIETVHGELHEIILKKDDTVHIAPLTPHRLSPTNRGAGAKVVEFSTTHEDSDSYRVGPRRWIAPDEDLG